VGGVVEVVVLALGCGLPALLVCASLSARGVPRLHLVGMVGLIGLAQACGGGIGSASGEWMFGSHLRSGSPSPFERW
jgi:hypothetical protein